MCGACAQQSHHCHVSYEEEDTCVGHVHSRVIIAHMTHGNDGSCRVMIAIENLSNIQHNAMVYIANN